MQKSARKDCFLGEEKLSCIFKKKHNILYKKKRVNLYWRFENYLAIETELFNHMHL